MTIWTILERGKTEAIFKATAAPILAEAKVAGKLKGKISADKLVSAESGKTYTFGDITATAIQGIHRGPIMLYQIKMGDITAVPRRRLRIRKPQRLPFASSDCSCWKNVADGFA